MLTRRQRWWIGGIALVIGVTAFLFSCGPKEPVHEGKSLHEWFDSLAPPAMYSEDDPSVRAIVAIGSDAVPFLMRELCISDSPWAERFRRLWSGLGLARRPYHPSRYRRMKAYNCLLYLGSKADSALPELIKIAEDEAHPCSASAIGVLGSIQSKPATVIPVLQRILADPLSHGFIFAINALARQGTNARPALARLKEIETDNRADVSIRIQAAQARVAIDPANHQSLDFIVTQWDNTNASRSWVAYALRLLGTNAMPALPAMRRMVQTESDSDLRASLSNSIHLLEVASGQPVGPEGTGEDSPAFQRRVR